MQCSSIVTKVLINLLPCLLIIFVMYIYMYNLVNVKESFKIFLPFNKKDLLLYKTINVSGYFI